ncbi:hypothetical protein D1624_28590 [Klebsiella pneumoniae]|uniref:hypothetical protein n=1 Tax=Klebsiella pneumoniae TaxID=573 RepID=UPI000E68B989|nr:hypothetical protein [Klebsiella pneumoniae]RIV01616.1 hypothetical protein D1624_28590 [Klebsiella pneumoniae]
MIFTIKKHKFDMEILYIPIVFILVLIGLYITNSQQKNVNALGCDNYGYMRQAELFRDNGFISGFNSDLTDPQITYLKDIAKRSDMPSDDWKQAIAPHCHHYIAETDKIVDQYPVGTGFIMSIFPEGKSQPIILILGCFLFACMLIRITSTVKFDVKRFVLTVVYILLFFFYINSPRTFSSQSIVLSYLLIPLLVFVNFKSRVGKQYNLFFIVVSGIISGVLINVRIPNVFVVAFTFFYLFRYDFTKTIIKNITSNVKYLSAWSGGVIFFGFIPFFYYNLINAGGILNTTYDSNDTKVNFLGIPKALGFYFSDIYSAALLIATAIFLLFGYRDYINGNKKIKFTLLIGLGFYLFNIIFFAAHDINNNYYPNPLSFIVLSTVFIEIVYACKQRTCHISTFFSYFIIICISLLNYVNTYSYRPTLDVPAWIKTDSVVWDYIFNGSLGYYNNHTASKLLHSTPATQDRLIDLVRRDGKEQYFINDDPAIKGVCDRIAAKYGVYPAGVADLFGIYDIWLLKPEAKLSPASSKGLSSCDHSLNFFPIQEIKNIVLSIEGYKYSENNIILSVIIKNNSDWPLFGGAGKHPVRLSWSDTKISKTGYPTTRQDIPKDTFIYDGASKSFDVKIPKSDIHTNVIYLSLLAEGNVWFQDHGLLQVSIHLQ